MPWDVKTVLSRREEFVEFARLEGANVSKLCRRFGVSRKTGYKWLGRSCLEDLSRRPKASPGRTPAGVEAGILEAAAEHPAWGGRKIRASLLAKGAPCPAASTVVAVLRRCGVLRQAPEAAGPWRRFEHAAPNDLWQTDFKGHFALRDGSRCHPLTVLDDCSRFALLVRACPDERAPTVRAGLEAAFRRYGLPWAVLCDNGPPWGGALTGTEVWLVRCGVETWHGRPYHPQTQGKLERFHRTLKAEALQGRTFDGLQECQDGLDRFRDCYNMERPHEALAMDRPVQRYRPSQREFDGRLLLPEYPGEYDVRKVQQGGGLYYRGRLLSVPKSLAGLHVGVRRVDEHVVEVRFFAKVLDTFDLRDYPKV